MGLRLRILSPTIRSHQVQKTPTCRTQRSSRLGKKSKQRRIRGTPTQCKDATPYNRRPKKYESQDSVQFTDGRARHGPIHGKHLLGTSALGRRNGGYGCKVPPSQ